MWPRRSKRPELAGIITTYTPHVPQVYVDVDRAKVMRQGVNIGDVYETMQTFMGGYLVNYFNRFGRQWQVYVEAEGDYRTRAENVGQFYVNNASGGSVPLERGDAISSRSPGRNSRCATTNTRPRRSIRARLPDTVRGK